MAKHSQHQQDASDSKRSGGGQAIVELCGFSGSGLAFWSRQRFDIGAELQVRIRRDALPDGFDQFPASAEGKWITLTGFVVECPAVRRPGGAHAFRVSLLLESALEPEQHAPASRKRPLRYLHAKLPGMARLGLN
jgi:hypothetical protein